LVKNFLKSARSCRAPIVSPLPDKRKVNSFGNSGERNLLTRSIDLDPFDLPIEEKFFRGAKRVCTIIAVAAVTISALDLMGIHSVETAAGFIHDNRQRIAELPDVIRSGIQDISFTSSDMQSASVAVKIPRDDVAKISAPLPLVIAARSDASPVAALAAARHEDAIELAMVSQAAWTKPELRTMPAPVLAPPSTQMILASADPDALPSPEMTPSPVSLPMSAAIPLDMVPMPRPAPSVLPPSPAERLHLEGKERVKAERCLANAIYFEARSEPVRGQMAVAQVVVNRAFSGFYPNDICGVVYQNASRHLACQFTFACDGKRKLINERGAWARANRIAKETLDGQIYVPEVAKSTHYHAVYVHPDWVREMKKMVRFGTHNFYRPIAWGNGAAEPAWGTASLAANKKN
jgi:hypothetical protein